MEIERFERERERVKESRKRERARERGRAGGVKIERVEQARRREVSMVKERKRQSRDMQINTCDRLS